MKEISFLPEFRQQISSARKTQTRRPMNIYGMGNHRNIKLDSVNTDEMVFTFSNKMVGKFRHMKSRYLPGDIVQIRNTPLKIKILDINVQRIEDMTEDEFNAEGIDLAPHPEEDRLLSWKESFRKVWVDIYGSCEYSGKYWIWVYKFEYIK